MDVNKEVKKYVDDLFKDVGASQQLHDLKQELRTNMEERIKDYQAKGMTEEEAFKEAKVSMGDLSGLVDDMREHGKDEAKQHVYTSMTNRVSIGGIVIGSMLILFGVLMSIGMMFMEIEPVAVPGTGIFAVAGAIVLTYSLLTRETTKLYSMNKVRAGLYSLAVGAMLFALFTGMMAGLATGEMFIAISSFTVIFIGGFGLWIGLILTSKSTRKKDQIT
ncbi:permease prefix domain 1-containing protein [Halalkalibacillus halophilus]|uniref:permease prefix domain 1-containing protein n=1 Tax=Halalkalibacillus halophilus TaxID=392827 RepID=UPI0003F60A0F|nr:permease prefix domain 1-containing protein [Halalkalibacillus halophilus]